ncbi:MAG: glycerophosphodiester phosphodiesterase [Gammaproteobacteria bacterium]|nr:glycerophosphodiester phosphodiesterase [Gammaproteobacteria bacterium]HBW84344.1 glycerophosphodiester phosphodiesterase [Gammaproteobacteria bacterium]
MRAIRIVTALFTAILMPLTSYAQKIVIAHRGASGYLPEHTLEAKSMAYAQGAHYIEQDLVMTSDDELIVLHDVTLDRTTDVDEKFPDRARDDGRYYAIDFTLAEIRTLNANEAFRIENGIKVKEFDNRFPIGMSDFRVPTFQEEIEMIQGLNTSTGRDVGIYPEIKQPAFHRQEGKEISTRVVEVLKEYGYTGKDSKVFLQTFDYDELVLIQEEIFPSVGIEVNLIMLLGNRTDYPWIFESDGMSKLANSADGIGPSYNLVVDRESEMLATRITDLVARAHDAGLAVHPYTFRADPGAIPTYALDFENLLDIHYFRADVDGVFTDFPDRAVQFLQSK